MFPLSLVNASGHSAPLHRRPSPACDELRILFVRGEQEVNILTLPDQLPFLYNTVDMLEHSNVGERIALDRDEVAIGPSREAPDLPLLAKRLRRFARR
jgi:hypothetical protein